MSLTTRAIIKSDWLNIAALDTTSDAMLDRIIAAVDAEIVNICGQPIEQTSRTVTILGNGTRYLPLSWTAPVTVTTVQEYVWPDSTPTTVTTNAVIASVGNINRLYRKDGPWITGYQYRITATVGYATVPADVVLCANEMVVEVYNETAFGADGSRLGLANLAETAGGVAVTKALQALRPKIEKRLLPYRVVTI